MSLFELCLLSSTKYEEQCRVRKQSSCGLYEMPPTREYMKYRREAHLKRGIDQAHELLNRAVQSGTWQAGRLEQASCLAPSFSKIHHFPFVQNVRPCEEAAHVRCGLLTLHNCCTPGPARRASTPYQSEAPHILGAKETMPSEVLESFLVQRAKRSSSRTRGPPGNLHGISTN